MQEVMGYFGLAFAIFCVAWILVPYLMGRTHLFTPSNLFLLGAANFVGIATAQAAFIDAYIPWAPKSWVSEYPDSVFIYFMIGAVIFFGAYALGFYLFKYPRRLASRTFNRWPDSTPNTLLMASCIAFGLSFGFFILAVLLNSPGISTLLGKFSGPMAIVGVCFLLYMWYQQVGNPIFAALAGVGVLAAAAMLLTAGSGRRPLLSLIIIICAVLYWARFWHKLPAGVLIKLAIPALVLAAMLAGYSSFRHGTRNLEVDYFQRSLVRIQQLPSQMSFDRILSLAGGDTTQASLLAIDRYHVKQERPKTYLHTIQYIIAHPIPRFYWDNKPVALGITMPMQTSSWRYSRANWGVGIIGHGYHDGGGWVLALYGLFVGIFFRYLDELLIQKQANPYVLAMLFCVSGEIVGLVRGEIGIFFINILVGLVCGWMVIRLTLLMAGQAQYSSQPYRTQAIHT